LVSDSDRFEFTPSNPWVAVGWRQEKAISVDLPERMRRFGIEFHSQGAKRVRPADDQLELDDGTILGYDFLVIATGPKLAFDEVPGLGPHGGYTQSICKTGHAGASFADFEKLVANPGPVVIGAAPAASCFGPA
jgi:sulfide:quinone oxidoreductase